MFGELPSQTLRDAQRLPLGAAQKSYEAVTPIVRGRR